MNQQNFSMQDILGVMGQNQRSGGAMGGGGGRGGAGGGGGMNGSLSNFLIGQQNGISTTGSFGINYSDQWGSKIAVTASYFFNKSSNKILFLIQTQISYSHDFNLLNDKTVSSSVNYNNRFNMRFVYTIDSSNTLMFVPSLNFQANRTYKTDLSITSLSESQLLNQTDNNTASNSQGENLTNQIVFRHKFQKKGRTISLGLTTGVNTKSINSIMLADDY